MAKSKNNVKTIKDVDVQVLKNMKLFESTYLDFDTNLGFSVCYTKVYGGFIRLVITPEAVSQIFIQVPASF